MKIENIKTIMHNHNNNQRSKRSMVWMTILCVLPLAIIFLTGKNVFSAGHFWPIVVGAFAVLHVVLMLRGHGSQGEDNSGDEKDVKNIVEKGSTSVDPASERSKNQKSHSCCH